MKNLLRLKKKIVSSVDKFDLDLGEKTVLTEAATGNYVVTPIIAAVAGADVYAFTRASKYGSADEVKKQTYDLAHTCGLENEIRILEDLSELDLDRIDILTNTGFLRPIDRNLIDRLSAKCVIPLMWEPWEFRPRELDLDACHQKGIKVYGTNEKDERVRTMEYLGYTVLFLLLKAKISPLSSCILLIGNREFVDPVEKILNLNNYMVSKATDYSTPFGVDLNDYSALVLLEHKRDTLVIGRGNAYIDVADIPEDMFVIHICGNVELDEALCFEYIPSHPRQYGYMSFTADCVDARAVIDLHTAGLKVAEGMITANRLGLGPREYKDFLEQNYPALAFQDSKYW